MLNTTKVLRYIERELGFRFNDLEMKPEEILDTIIDYTIPTFSKFHPKQERLVLREGDLVEGSRNIYYLNSENEIININRVIGANNKLFNAIGYAGPMNPAAGFLAGSPIDGKMMADLMGINLNPSTYRLIQPNKIELLSSSSVIKGRNILIVLNTFHDEHFASIPNNMRDYFLELALCDVQISLYAMRSRFTNLQTTFGEINLNTDEISGAKDRRKELVEKMESKSILNSNRKKIFFG